MGIDVSVQYNGGLLPDMIMLTQGYYHRGTRLTTMCDGVLHCFWCVVNVFLLSLHGD